MTKVDHKRELSRLYAPSATKAVLVDVPALNFLMIDGMGDPNTSRSYAEAVEALFAVSYALKFDVKKRVGTDYAVMPLEGLWWADDMSSFTAGDRSQWQWTMMIMQPELVDEALFQQTAESVGHKKTLPALACMRFDSFTEGLAAQILHRGPFTEEASTIRGLHDFIASTGHRVNGKHHEIYLSDIRRAAPSKWRTIIRQPVSL